MNDRIWHHAIFYKLSADSVYWNSATMTFLSKAYVEHAPTALLCLLQKEAHQLSLWEREWEHQSPSVSSFLHAVQTWGRFSNTNGQLVSIEHFWKNFSTVIEGLREAPGFEFSRNEEGIIYMNLLQEEDIRRVICFNDSWHEQNYFIETTQDWILFNWKTAA